jgi:hypothetical protein
LFLLRRFGRLRRLRRLVLAADQEERGAGDREQADGAP